MMRISQDIIDYYRQFGADEKLAQEAYKERSKAGSQGDILMSHGLPDEIIDKLKDIFRLEWDIKEAYLVQRKVIHVPEDPLWVVIIKTGTPWYQLRLRSPQQQVGNLVSNELRDFFERGTFIVTVDFPIYIKKAQLIQDSSIYKVLPAP